LCEVVLAEGQGPSRVGRNRPCTMFSGL
jgi:hypothetical protein